MSNKTNTIEDIKEKIEAIRTSDFQIEDFNFYGRNHKISVLLRSDQICVNSISNIDDIHKEDKTKLYKQLDEIIKGKIKYLNPNFTEDILDNMTSTYKRGYTIYPMDILVLDDAVFHKEGEYNDFSSIYKIKTFMFQNMKPYYDAFGIDFTLRDFSPFSKKKLTTEEDIYTSKFISENINSITNKNITKPLYELNTENTFYRHGGLTSGDESNANIYINMKFDDIGRSIKEQNECDIKICIQSEEDIILYYIHQSFEDNKPVWNVVKTNNEIWKLTEEALKLENKNTNKVYKK